MVRITLDIDEKLLEDLKKQALNYKSSYSDLCCKFIKQGLDNMSTVTISDEVMEKVNIKCRRSNKTPFEVINEVLWDALGKMEEIPDDIDGDKIWNLLEHDKPEGDDILDRITDMFD
ncbi:hypothetical protein [uncultured Methanobrevibacter sp.]|uniref:hypothetical protein n=1 Tax=Methanobrevibacter sp. TaxID=66852 RepID=UPI0025EB5AD4|nr:hypothetical protein [uncultured Methanobrevibacter sp.]